MLPVLAEGLFDVVPWSVVILIAVVAIGLLLVRAAITVVKVLIIVASGVAIYLGVRFLLNL